MWYLFAVGNPKLLSYSKGFKLLGGYFLLAEALDLLELLAFVILSVSILGACLHSAKPKETWERMERRLAFPVCLCAAAAAKSLQSCPTLCDPIDGSLPGSSVRGILQARTLEWVAISFSNA